MPMRYLESVLETAGLGPVAGVDEAGRGACCGPMTIAACVMPDHDIDELAELTDSKKLTPAKRERLFPLIQNHAQAWSIIHISPQDIDYRGIQHANTSGMRRAVATLGIRAGYVLSDALKIPGLPVSQLPIVGGDNTARCIAAASVLAKVSRDRLMIELEQIYPGYGFASHKGYVTTAHREAIARLGATPEHRYSYANVVRAHREWLANH